MSSYAGIYVNDKEVFAFRNEVFPEVLSLFMPKEFLYLKGRDAVPYASNWSVDEMSEEEIDDIEVQAYQTTASILKDRLSVLGFGEQLAKGVIEEIVIDDTRRKEDLREALDDRDIKDKIEQEIAYLNNFDYETWKTEVSRYIAAREHERRSGWRDHGPLSLLEYVEARILLRIIVDQVADDEVIVLDVSELFEGGWMDEGGNTREGWQANLEAVGPPILITEGTYDAQVLQGAIEVLKPHLKDYIRFLDYEVGNEGGASAAVKMLKSFAAAGISNRIVAVFDNDSAAYEAVMGLQGSKLPSHYKVAHYPDLELANAYPTLGPQGETVMNVNRLAGSIELYLGTDVLSSVEGSLTPVQWKGYMGKVGAYQGEVMNKSALQASFRQKLKDAKADRSKTRTQDWSDLTLVLDSIIETLSAMSAYQYP